MVDHLQKVLFGIDDAARELRSHAPNRRVILVVNEIQRLLKFEQSGRDMG